MNIQGRWHHCIKQRGQEVELFVKEHFGEQHRQVLLLAGAGFDPRASKICELLSITMEDRVHGFFVREERPNPNIELVKRADLSQEHMVQLIPESRVAKVEVFAPDGAVVGARALTKQIHDLELIQYTDIIVDISALSVGLAFPVIRYLLERIEANQLGINLHVMVIDEPETDEEITATASDTVGTILGFKGGLELDQNKDAARLWLPQLVKGQHSVLERIQKYVQPHDVCPILPFPALNPRLSDGLIEAYAEEFESTWEVDMADIIYAAQTNPLDLYQTILRMDNERRHVFEEVGSSLIILSPIGSKVLAIGALMAAIERDFPVAYIEAISYTVDFQKMDQRRTEVGEIVHVWLSGEAYPPHSSTRQ